MTSRTTLFERAVSGLRSLGRNPELDESLQTVTFDDHGRSTVGVVMTNADAVVFYSVWPAAVPDDVLVGMSEYVMRANTDLYTAALELDLDKGIVSARSAVPCGPLADADDTVFAALLSAALDDANAVAADHHAGLACVVAGGSPIDALAMRTR